MTTIQGVQPFLQFNPYVLRGYRQPMGYAECLRSLLYLHNESLNVHLHLFGMLFFFYQATGYFLDGTGDGQYMGLLGLFLGIGFIGSCMYHCFMPACCSSDVYYWWLGIDLVFGIIGIAAAAHSLIIYGFRCYPPWFSNTTYLLLVSFALYAIRATVTASSVKQRMGFAGVFCILRAVLGLVFFIPRMQVLGWTDAFTYHLLSFCLLVVGGFLNIVRIPEKYLPGYFDYSFNSHVLWHICSLVSAIYCYMGNAQDLIDYGNTICVL